MDGAGDAERSCRLLAEGQVSTVRGNHDRWFLAGQSRDLPEATQVESVSSFVQRFLSALPASRVVSTAAGPLLLCHGVGDNDMAALKPDDFGYAVEVNDSLQRLVRAGEVRFAVCGHTHVRMVRRLGGVTFINPGTLRRSQEPGVALLDLDAGVVAYHDLAGEGVGAAVARVPVDGPDWPGGAGP